MIDISIKIAHLIIDQTGANVWLCCHRLATGVNYSALDFLLQEIKHKNSNICEKMPLKICTRANLLTYLTSSDVFLLKTMS